MTQCGDAKYTAVVPEGYTHIIFLEYDDGAEQGTWDNVINQTSDLIVPVGEANHFYLETNEWTIPVE